MDEPVLIVKPEKKKSLTTEQKSFVKSFFRKNETEFRSAKEVFDFFSLNHPNIGEFLKIETLRKWRREILRPSKRKKPGKKKAVSLEIRKEIINSIHELGVNGSPMNSTIARGIIKGI